MSSIRFGQIIIDPRAAKHPVGSYNPNAPFKYAVAMGYAVADAGRNYDLFSVFSSQSGLHNNTTVLNSGAMTTIIQKHRNQILVTHNEVGKPKFKLELTAHDKRIPSQMTLVNPETAPDGYDKQQDVSQILRTRIVDGLDVINWLERTNPETGETIPADTGSS